MRIGRVLGVAILTMAIATMSKVMWLLPIEIIDSDFYQHWLTFRGKEITFYLVAAWFAWGSFKMLIIAYNDPKERFLNDLRYTIKLYLMVPIVPLLNLQLKRPFFPFEN